jgi:DNA-binding FrmR family transcriptional regulator
MLLPQYKTDAAHRLRVAVGHLKAVERMVAEEQYCIDIMKQLAAVQANLESVQQVLLKNHLSTCVTEAILRGSGESLIEELVTALRYTKGLAADGDSGGTGHGLCSHHGLPGDRDGPNRPAS